jgi:hypothetical protein
MKTKVEFSLKRRIAQHCYKPLKGYVPEVKLYSPIPLETISP